MCGVNLQLVPREAPFVVEGGGTAGRCVVCMCVSASLRITSTRDRCYSSLTKSVAAPVRTTTSGCSPPPSLLPVLACCRSRRVRLPRRVLCRSSRRCLHLRRRHQQVWKVSGAVLSVGGGWASCTPFLRSFFLLVCVCARAHVCVSVCVSLCVFCLFVWCWRGSAAGDTAHAPKKSPRPPSRCQAARRVACILSEIHAEPSEPHPSRSCLPAVDAPPASFASSSSGMTRNVYYIREVDGEMTLGTIVSDSSVEVIGFAKDKNVRAAPSGSSPLAVSFFRALFSKKAVRQA